VSCPTLVLVQQDTSADELDISRPDRLSSAEIASICQGAGLQGMSSAAYTPQSLHELTIIAVRKNRYVILPIDFEESWKVSL
jgi:26S proteasome regulatory subunit T3